MLAATLERQRKTIYLQGETEGFVKGRAEGRVEGRVEGIQAAQRQSILRLLQFRFDPAEMEQARFAEQLEKIQILEQLNQLLNGLLNKESKLEDFIVQLASYLPTTQAK